MLQLDQNNVKLLQDILCKFTTLGDLVLYAFCGTIENGGESFLLQQHCRFVRCLRDENCVAGGMLSPPETFPKLLSYMDSELTGSGEV